MRHRIPRVIVLALLLSGPARAQQGKDPVSVGTRLLQEERWDDAAEVFGEVTRAEPENAVAWYRLGMALQESGRHAPAIDALERAAALGFQTPYARVRIARAHAALQDTQAALAALERAVAEGLDAPDLLEHPQLQELADGPRFRDAVAAVRVNADPCTHGDGYHALDFWIGEWDVYDPAGQRVGGNVVEPLLGSCAILENWTDSRGNEGKSLNVYDRSTGLWRQLWVSDRGNVMDYSVGEVHDDGALRFEGSVAGAEGGKVRRRMIFTPVATDTVRQEIFQSSDGGASWTPSWTGVYVRRPASGD